MKYLLLLLFIACTAQPQPAQVESTTQESSFIPLANREIQTSDNLQYIVPPNEILSGGPPKDGIPSIDNPTYVSAKEADAWIADNELLLAINYKGINRAYPLQIMVWHEIVNDEIAGDHLLITYCPLCGSGIAYERTINNEPVEFGTSGNLWQSNLVMYDRKTDSLWTQIDGIAIVGELTKTQLNPVQIDTLTWRDWFAAHPQGEVLSQDTGFNRQYGNDPYGNYYEESFLMFPVDEQDNRIHAKTPILGFEINGSFKAYRESDAKQKEIKDKIANVPITITATDAGEVTAIRLDTNERLIPERSFWFAWYAFHPQTTLYES